jgi:hypothetical protein
LEFQVLPNLGRCTVECIGYSANALSVLLKNFNATCTSLSNSTAIVSVCSSTYASQCLIQIQESKHYYQFSVAVFVLSSVFYLFFYYMMIRATQEKYDSALKFKSKVAVMWLIELGFFFLVGFLPLALWATKQDNFRVLYAIFGLGSAAKLLLIAVALPTAFVRGILEVVAVIQTLQSSEVGSRSTIRLFIGSLHGALFLCVLSWL